jgi:hypothetical protein
MFLHPVGMPGLLQPPGPADPIQRLALMMALMVLGMPPVYSCHTTTGCGMPRICPPVGSGREIGISATKEELDTRQWRRLHAIHCMAMQSSLSFMCGPDGRTRKVKYEKFRQTCGVQPAACWGSLRSGRLKVGEADCFLATVFGGFATWWESKPPEFLAVFTRQINWPKEGRGQGDSRFDLAH